MKITISGASGLIGGKLAARLRDRGDEVTVLSRSASTPPSTWQWDPLAGPAPVAALAGRDAVVHLAGEPLGQRLTGEVKDRVRNSRVAGTRNLVEGLRAVPGAERPQALVSSSGVAYYGPRGDEEVTEQDPPGGTFLAEVSAAWEQEAARAAEFRVRVVRMRTGVVLDASGGTVKSPRGAAPTTARHPNRSPSGSFRRRWAGRCTAPPSSRCPGSLSGWRSASWRTW
ncbi:NAD-dependent epimerase/dehydratase family protein [Amycolatopsis sp. DG1A-15b]|uniref:NAD-dependent epimerase/dehydratase family protein n=1 Tax=Amycolatopsis sp. DG1A-15b TaxID=3052846 RepID=UPI00255BAB20|nr:NAD-dependent epimerase/dehydratase family protein [Amycolatopsis sp. DG1A-15b]WIX90267.1 NAD-dependent epimerase/dehydratase family protein [Amycolatopsis sp. DG1A-15b]